MNNISSAADIIVRAAFDQRHGAAVSGRRIHAGKQGTTPKGSSQPQCVCPTHSAGRTNGRDLPDEVAVLSGHERHRVLRIHGLRRLEHANGGDVRHSAARGDAAYNEVKPMARTLDG